MREISGSFGALCSPASGVEHRNIEQKDAKKPRTAEGNYSKNESSSYMIFPVYYNLSLNVIGLARYEKRNGRLSKPLQFEVL